MAPTAPLRQLRRLPGAADGRQWCLHAPRRWKVSGKNRFNVIRRLANEQHVDYFRQLQPPRPHRPLDLDPKLQNLTSEVQRVFKHPELTQQPSEEVQLLAPEAALQPRHSGVLGKVDIEPYGSIEVVHGDIFTAEAQAVILPMAPNLLPYRGLSLEAFDRGGPGLVQQTFNAAREECRAQETEEAGLRAGDCLLVPGSGVRAEHILFAVMPWFWQGSPMDAGKRFRNCARQALLRAASGQPPGISSVALPHIGGGIYGYEPRGSCRALLEEAVEALLQLEAQAPSYTLRRISFVEDRLETAEELHNALVEVAHRWLPERRLTTAPQWWAQATRRLVVLPDAPNFFWKRHRVKFKKYHGVKRHWRRNYIGNVIPWLWRAQRVQQPPPLLVLRESGEAAPQGLQLKPRPYFFRGVTHWLFPSRRSGFHQLRKSSKGHWIGRLQQYRLREDFRPRM